MRENILTLTFLTGMMALHTRECRLEMLSQTTFVLHLICYILQVQPVKDFPQPEINKASQDLIAQYNRELYHQGTESDSWARSVSQTPK